MTSAAILATVFLTSILSGVLGMAGGVILMALLTGLLSVPAAMMVHGISQATANGARVWLLRRHVRWTILPPYLLGAAVAVAAFLALRVVPDRGWVLLLVGAFPWIGRVRHARAHLDIQRPPIAIVCGSVVTAAQLLAGASGALLDVFYLRSSLTRHQIVATKAFTQTLGHLLKLGYYGAVLAAGRDGTVPGAWTLLAVLPLAMLGTRLGTALLDRVSEARFRQASEVVVLAIGTACMIAGAFELTSGHRLPRRE